MVWVMVVRVVVWMVVRVLRVRVCDGVKSWAVVIGSRGEVLWLWVVRLWLRGRWRVFDRGR